MRFSDPVELNMAWWRNGMGVYHVDAQLISISERGGYRRQNGRIAVLLPTQAFVFSIGPAVERNFLAVIFARREGRKNSQIRCAGSCFNAMRCYTT